MHRTASQRSCDRRRQPFRDLVLTVSVALGLLAWSVPNTSAQQGNPNPRIVPPNAVYDGLTYGEWMAKFNQWYLSIPASVNPLILGNEKYLSIGQPEHLWFLGNTEPVVERHFVVPAGTALFATIFIVEWDNLLCVDPDTNYTVDELRALAKSVVDSFTDIQVEVDGVPVKDVAQYRSTTPVFSVTLSDENFPQSIGCTDVLPGTYGPMVADGYALILPPLPVGEHTVHEAGVLHDIVVDVTWHIAVVPPNH